MKSATDALGAKLINIGFKDTRIMHSTEAIDAINKVIGEYGWHHGSNPDHSRTNHAVVPAARYVPNIPVCVPMHPSGPAYTTFNARMDLPKCLKSQIEKFGSGFSDATMARARHRGYEIGCKYTELFEVIRTVVKFG